MAKEIMDFRYLLNKQLTSVLHALPEDFNVLAMALESTNSGVVITDNRLDDNPIIFCNHAFENMTGYPREEIIGKNCRFLQGNDQAQQPLTLISDSIAKGVPITVELRNYHRNGTLFWNELSIAPVRNSEGKVTHFIGIQNDITQKKTMETELMEQIDILSNRLAKQEIYIKNVEEVLFGIMESARECLVILDKNLHVVKANPNFYELFQLSPEDVLDKKFTAIISVYDNETTLSKMFNDALNKALPFNDFRLNLSKDQCDEARVSANKIGLVGIKDDYLLVKIRCNYINKIA
jgi:PAS domain S-box-containing protein